MTKESFKEFSERVRHSGDSLFCILFIIPLTVRIAYLIKKYNLNITPNQVSYSRLFILSPLIVFLLFLAPILDLRILYFVVAVLFYFVLFTDWLDGQIARGLNKTSKKGEFLDAIADRTSIIIFLTLIISIGLFTQNLFIICGGVLLFVIKTFNLMVISKIFYYKENIYSDRTKNMWKLFGGDDANEMGMAKFVSLFVKLNEKYLKIKRWNPGINAPERYVLTIVVPLLLIFFNLETIAVYLLGILILAFIFFFVKRIKNLFRDFL